MALGILPEIFSRSDSNVCVDGDAIYRREERLEGLLFVRTGAVPKLRDGDGRAQQWGVAATQLIPAGEDAVIPGAGNFNKDVRID